MPKTETLSSELTRVLARLAAMPQTVTVSGIVLPGDTVAIRESDPLWGALYTANLIWVKPIYHTCNVTVMLTDKGWSALKEAADAQGDL